MPVAPEPGIAAPPAPMPISDTTTSWLVVMSPERTTNPDDQLVRRTASTHKPLVPFERQARARRRAGEAS
jgi:hypothetical protein